MILQSFIDHAYTPDISLVIPDVEERPSMKKGFVDASVQVLGLNFLQDKNNTYVYYTVTSILPKKIGNHKVCVQIVNAAGQTADELCYSIEVTAEPSKPVSHTKPQFIAPTLPDGSSIECSVGKACHTRLWTKSQIYNSNCPMIESNMNAQDGIFVFQSDTDPSPCSTDVSIHTEIERTITVCFTLNTPPGKFGLVHGGEGEKRCYNITITKETLHARGPCSRLICMNQGFCNGKDSNGFCQCSSGYSGLTCQLAHGNSLTAPHSQPGASIGDHVLPQKVVCVLHEECSIPFTVTSSSQQPSVRYGPVEAGLSSKGTTVIQDPKNPGTFLCYVIVVGTTTGVHKTCVQTGDTRELTSDEFCFEVEIKSPDSYQHQVETSQPYFITPTIPHDSVTQCVPGKSCHALLFMSGGFYPVCPFVKQTEGPSNDLHIFTSADNTKLFGNCTTDVTFTPPPGSTGKDRFCFNIYLPNIPGETRCFYVIYMEYTPVPIINEHFPLGCTDYEDINFSCRNWNNSIGICRTTYGPVHTIARHRCPRFCSLCQSSIGAPQSQLLPTIASGTCGNILGNDCLTINITNICRNTFGQKYCAKHCNQCTESVGLLPDLGSLFGRK
ncbi:uncharacterized protein [Mytilus edulis]|uniref:uncharacterized protein n=1 Tax=Mytilus edulis TaxID=6550 RepID=UPI0039EE239E